MWGCAQLCVIQCHLQGLWLKGSLHIPTLLKFLLLCLKNCDSFNWFDFDFVQSRLALEANENNVSQDKWCKIILVRRKIILDHPPNIILLWQKRYYYSMNNVIVLCVSRYSINNINAVDKKWKGNRNSIGHQLQVVLMCQ